MRWWRKARRRRRRARSGSTTWIAGSCERLARFAVHALGAEWFDDLLDQNAIDTEPDEVSAQLVGPCAMYEAKWEGKTIAERFLESTPRGIEQREREWLAAQAHSALSVWEVRAVNPGVRVEVSDLLTGEERTVLERGATQSLRVRDNVLAPVVDFEGLSVFCGMHGRALPPRPCAAFLKNLRRSFRLGSQRVTGSALRTKMDFGAWLLGWESTVDSHDEAAAQMPKLHNTDGDPLLMIKDHYAFDPSERSRIEAQLAAMAEADDDDDGAATDERVFVFDRPRSCWSPRRERLRRAC